MAIKRLVLLMALLCSAVGVKGTVRAEESLNNSSENAMSARIDQLEAEIAALRRQPSGELPGPYAGPVYGGNVGCGCEGDCGCAPSCGCQDDCCGGCWCAPGCSCGFYGGAEVMWAQPRWRAFDAVTTTTGTGTAAAPFTSNTQGFDYDYDPTARFFVGFTGCNGLGVRASWWQFDHDANDVTVTVPTTGPFVFVTGPLLANYDAATGFPRRGETFVATQSLKLETWDLEATSCFEACGGNVIAGFGVRYAKFDVTTREAEFAAAAAAPFESADLRESFEGWGPTVDMEFVRPLCFSGFSLYSSMRGSVLIGQQHQTARLFASPGTALTDLASRDANEALGIAELQIALQWCHCGWFARAGWQAQYWDDMAGDPAPPVNNGNFAPPRGGIDGVSSNNRSDLIVQGFFFTAGAQY